jgi:hypothetical protein
VPAIEAQARKLHLSLQHLLAHDLIVVLVVLSAMSSLSFSRPLGRAAFPATTAPVSRGVLGISVIFRSLCTTKSLVKPQPVRHNFHSIKSGSPLVNPATDVETHGAQARDNARCGGRSCKRFSNAAARLSGFCLSS